MKVISIKIDDQFHKKMKLQALTRDQTIKEYVSELIRKDLQKEKE